MPPRRSPRVAATAAVTGPRLTTAELGRATLARQLLLDPARDVDVVTAMERIAGLQAQEPASPYIGLWARLADFAATDLDTAFRDRRAVKGTLMRSTLHAVSSDDYRHFLPAVFPMLRGIRRQDRRQPPDAERMAELMAAAAAFTREPRGLSELRDHLAGLDGGDGSSPDLGAEEILWWLRRRAPFIHAPNDEPWSFGRRPRLVDADAWLGDGVAKVTDAAVGGDNSAGANGAGANGAGANGAVATGAAAAGAPTTFADPMSALEHLVRRYLAAFGPATAADLAQWSGLAVGSLRPAIDAIDAGGELRRFGDERGRVLLDLEGAPLPPGGTPAPPRLLPMWDSILLAFADRTRVISDADRAVVIAKNGDTLPTFLVDGRVAGLWWAERDGGGRVQIVLDPFRTLAPSDRRALEREGERLAAFVEPLEPGVYGRYRRHRVARPAG